MDEFSTRDALKTSSAGILANNYVIVPSYTCSRCDKTGFAYAYTIESGLACCPYSIICQECLKPEDKIIAQTGGTGIVSAKDTKIFTITDSPVTQGALRFDSGKPELHHIHPIAWEAYISNRGPGHVSTIIVSLNKAFDDFFYNDKNHLSEIWKRVHKEDILEMTKVLEFGAKKYASLNYAKGMKYSRVINSFRRHILKMIDGETNDDESGISHMGHIMCNYMFILTYATEKPKDCDDRVILNQGDK